MKNKITNYLTLFAFFFAGIILADATIPTFQCPDYLVRVGNAYRSTLVNIELPVREADDYTGERHYPENPSLDFTASPSTYLKSIYGEDIFSPLHEAGLYRLEGDILDLLSHVPPEAREVEKKSLMRKYEIPDTQQGRDLIDDIILHVWYVAFDGHPEIIGNHLEAHNRLSYLRLNYYRASNQNPTSRRYHYYIANLSKLSVPTMAKQLEISESQVYSDIRNLGLTITESFDAVPSSFHWSRIELFIGDRFTKAELQKLSRSSILEISRAMRTKNIQENKIAASLNVGLDALRFFWHHSNVRGRGDPWDRFIPVGNNERMPERQLLLTLNHNGYSHREIADVLNNLTHQKDPTSDCFRTENAVGSQLKALGVTSHQTRSLLKEVTIAGYGKVKQRGRLKTDNAIHYIRSHVFQSIPQLAHNLQVTPSGLRAFLQRNQIILPGYYATPNSPLFQRSTHPSEFSQTQRVERTGATNELAGKAIEHYKQSRKNRTPEESLENMITQITRLGKMPPTRGKKKVAELTQLRKDEVNAYQFAIAHRWTQDEIDALPSIVQPIIQPVFERQQSGPKRARTPEESLENMITQITRLGKMPSLFGGKKVAELTQLQRDERNAFLYAIRHAWTQDEVNALPSIVQPIIQPVFERQQSGQKNRTPKESLENMITQITRLGKMPPGHSNKKAAELTQLQKDERSAYSYAIAHRWTQVEIDALPSVVQPIIQIVYERQNNSN